MAFGYVTNWRSGGAQCASTLVMSLLRSKDNCAKYIIAV
jgi:hypothetical protein